jgi:transcriptional regulator of acetoin/glycerol metabolism
MSTRSASHHAAIQKARYLFLERGEVPSWLPRPLVDSWRRSARLGVAHGRDQAGPLVRQELQLAKERSRTLLRMAALELDALAEYVTDAPGMVLLTDADGLVLERRGHVDFLHRADQVALQPGADWSEGARGTNAIGTALAEQRPVDVWAHEHFLDANEVLTCSAAPIVTPTGDLAGVLDVSGDARMAPGLTRGMVQMAVAQIEHRWFTQALAGRRVLSLQGNPALLGTWQEAILLFEGDTLLAANRVAITMLGLDWASLKQVRFQHLFKGDPPGELTVPLELRDGRRVYGHCRGERRTATSTAGPGPVRPPGPAGIFWDTSTREQLSRAVRAVNADLPVLILGETGTGKEMFARALHASSRRSDKPMVTLNCAAIPESLIESELFGYEPGAFTGARAKGSQGKVREAAGGILFLDEIGDMPLSLQARLLRVLQNREVLPLGGSRAVVVDFVPVCATNRDLEAEVAAGRVRADLFYRLHHFCVRLSPLRERPEFPALLDTILEGCGARERGVGIGAEARQALRTHRWPGNFRELGNLVRTLVALADDGACISLDDLPPEFRCRPAEPVPEPEPDLGPAEAAEAPVPLATLTRQAVEQAILAHHGNMTAAARALGLHRSTLYRILQRPVG